MKRSGELQFNSMQEGELWSGGATFIGKGVIVPLQKALILIFSLFAKVQMHPVKKSSVHPGTGHCAQWENVAVFNDYNKLLTFFGGFSRCAAFNPLAFCLTATINLENFNTLLQQRRLC